MDGPAAQTFPSSRRTDGWRWIGIIPFAPYFHLPSASGFSHEKDKERAGKALAGQDITEHGRVVAKSITLSTVGYSFSNQTGVLVIEREAGQKLDIRNFKYHGLKASRF